VGAELGLESGKTITARPSRRKVTYWGIGDVTGFSPLDRAVSVGSHSFTWSRRWGKFLPHRLAITGVRALRGPFLM
jgi:hypothetical protein